MCDVEVIKSCCIRKHIKYEYRLQCCLKRTVQKVSAFLKKKARILFHVKKSEYDNEDIDNDHDIMKMHDSTASNSSAILSHSIL